MHRKFIFILSLFISSLVFFYSVSLADNLLDYELDFEDYSDYVSHLLPIPEIAAPSAILVEAGTGQVLYAKDSQMPLHISSACKLMTVLVALENADLYSNVTVGTDSVGTEGSAISLEIGAKYPLEDLLYAIMLTSANDAATAVAEHVSAGDISKFVEKMNETAVKLTMMNTHFTNPTGLYDETQFTTAGDISLLIKYATKNTTFNKIFSAKARPWYGPETEPKILTSSHKLFWGYNGFEGGKTGYNKKEQQTVVSTASRNNMKLICVILDTPEKSMYTDTSDLFNYGFQNFRKSILVNKGEVIKTVEFEGKDINLISQSEVVYVHPLGESYIKEFNSTADLKSPLKKAIPAGSAKYILKDDTVINVSLYPETEIIPPDDFITSVRKKVLENKDIFLLVLFLIAIEAILLVFNIGKLIKKLVLLIIKRFRRHA